eukprot:TRINITY_DN10950_c0_g1_i8.p1 TRINITY_DN10950_c0_g1~~TRINITY_DN10950_c0_g1_i8.p1  ORF type:complete len:130 (+),score=15.00 TRINITY_DN10950_c0_g1_i8:43-390(+)
MKIPFLGSIPLDPQLLTCCEKGESFLATSSSPAVIPFRRFITRLVQRTDSLAETHKRAKDLSLYQLAESTESVSPSSSSPASSPLTLSPSYRSEERFSRNAETDLVCRLLLEKKK